MMELCKQLVHVKLDMVNEVINPSKTWLLNIGNWDIEICANYETYQVELTFSSIDGTIYSEVDVYWKDFLYTEISELYCNILEDMIQNIEKVPSFV